MSRLVCLAPDLYVHQGAINVGILRSGDQALLIDCGDGDVAHALRLLGIDAVEKVIFTHHHRDQASGFHRMPLRSACVGVPASEHTFFADVRRLWHDPAQRWHLYDSRPNLLLATSIPVHETYVEGDTVGWHGHTISVLDTPGHTDGSVSYLLTVRAGTVENSFLFTGDLIYGHGQVWDLYSLQKGVATRDYHGFMGDRERLKASLRKMAALHAEAWVPAHGPVIHDPLAACALLTERLDACYAQYVAISALRHYFPSLFRGHEDLAGALPFGDGLPPPPFLRHLGTTWVVSSEEGPAFALDCGTKRVVQQLATLQLRGEMGPLEWLWVTHYHDDHVDAIPVLAQVFGCPVVAETHVAQVIERPMAWRLPCISPVRVPVDRVVTHGEHWSWREFTVTALHLPGQTLYHGGLLVEGRGHRLLFVGDSFTMAGIDDYCPGNRNLLGPGVGFDACLQLIKDAAPDLILNNHVDRAFRFTSSALQLMRDNLAAREQTFGSLVPWDHPNYGLDEHWVHCHPYEQQVSAGEQTTLSVVCTNHSSSPRQFRSCPVLPVSWEKESEEKAMLVRPKAEAGIDFVISVPADVQPGRWIIPVEVTYDGRHLGQFREAVLVVTEGKPQEQRRVASRASARGSGPGRGTGAPG